MSDFAITPRVASTTCEEAPQEQSPHTAAPTAPIQGSIDSSVLGLRGLEMLRRLLMKGASALGLESPPSCSSDLANQIEVIKEPLAALSLMEKVKRTLLASSLICGTIRLGESFLSFAFSAWERASINGQSARHTTTREIHAHTYERSTDTEGPRPTSELPRVLVEVAKVLEQDNGKKESELVTAALQQCAEAIRRQNEEDNLTHREEQARAERTRHARGIIREIDARGGRIANNPKVQDILASLGTPYDSIEQAIAQVIALQKEEDEVNVH
jgi:hypothetical protein